MARTVGTGRAISAASMPVTIALTVSSASDSRMKRSMRSRRIEPSTARGGSKIAALRPWASYSAARRVMMRPADAEDVGRRGRVQHGREVADLGLRA